MYLVESFSFQVHQYALPQVVNALHQDIARFTVTAVDLYFYGTQLAALARLVNIAENLGQISDASTARNKLKAAILPCES